MNEIEATQALAALGSNWPHLRQLDAVAIELWYRNALRDTPASGNGTDEKPDALEVVDRLVATMTYEPKPADWIRVYNEIRTERRRRNPTMVNVLEEPELTIEERKANIARLRELIASKPMKGLDQ